MAQALPVFVLPYQIFCVVNWGEKLPMWSLILQMK